MTTRLLVPELVLVRGGDFTMGNDRGRADERPAHRVRVESFYAGVRPVRNAEYLTFVAGTGHEPPPFLEDERFSDREQPVVGVSWHDAVAFCRWLSGETGRRVRLPSEAEREYAALGGRDGADWPWEGAAPEEHAPTLARLDRPHVPTEACINGFGLYCLADNVHEWCSDWYDPLYYERSPGESPPGPAAGRRRSSRGGSWRHAIKFTRISARSSLDPAYRYNDYGFRVYADA
jgi:sulfatase modifying factor 1